jgi:hypothetical protein
MSALVNCTLFCSDVANSRSVMPDLRRQYGSTRLMEAPLYLGRVPSPDNISRGFPFSRLALRDTTTTSLHHICYINIFISISKAVASCIIGVVSYAGFELASARSRKIRAVGKSTVGACWMLTSFLLLFAERNVRVKVNRGYIGLFLFTPRSVPINLLKVSSFSRKRER